ncbi:MAG: ABC transporter ATP-binding protein [Anaerolineae bacterium]
MDVNRRSRDDTPIIRLDGVTKVYVEAGQSHTVLDNVSADFAPGEFVVLLGKSGSGKSTLLNLVSGIDSPSSGDIWVSGQPITRMGDRERTIFRRLHIGFVFQFFNLIPTLTVQENVFLPVDLAAGGKSGRQRGLDLLERVGLGNRLGAYPDRLSGGEQQRVAIARALAHDPPLVLADEPTGNLDEDTGRQVLSLLDDLVREAGKSLLMVTHSPEVVGLADRVYRVRHGHLVEETGIWQPSSEDAAAAPDRLNSVAPTGTVQGRAG